MASSADPTLEMDRQSTPLCIILTVLTSVAVRRGRRRAATGLESNEKLRARHAPYEYDFIAARLQYTAFITRSLRAETRLLTRNYSSKSYRQEGLLICLGAQYSSWRVRVAVDSRRESRLAIIDASSFSRYSRTLLLSLSYRYLG